MTSLFRSSRNAVASSSRLTLPSFSLPCRSFVDQPEEPAVSDPNHYDARGRLAGLDERTPSPTTLFAAKVPNFYTRDMIKARYEKYQIKVADVYIPLPKNEEGKIRRNNRRFAFVEVQTEEDMRKALAINPEKMGHVSMPSRQTIEEARTYADWAYSAESKKRMLEAKKPMKPWQRAQMEPEERKRIARENQWK